MTFAHLWWVKEYRFDRMGIHLQTKQGALVYFSSWRKPPKSPKSLFLVASTCILLGWVYILLPWNIWIKLLIIDVLSFPFTFPLVLLFTVPTKLYHRFVIYKAKHILTKYPQLLVIGVTGSYGKTSVKEYIAAILSHTYKVLKTQASKNSPIGIAEVILRDLKPDHQVFVVEMGAYKLGEIEAMAHLVKPQIGIITAINAQHQDLFGTIETTMKAKYELIHNLTGKKIAILNADDFRVQEMGTWAQKDDMSVVWYSKYTPQDSHIAKDGDTQRAFASDHIADMHGISFIYHAGGESVSVSAPLLGEHQIGNVTAAISASIAAGMSTHDACLAAHDLEQPKHTLETIENQRGIFFIDDTFNNNPDAARAAIQFIAQGTGKKILIFQPMIELGAYAHTSHEEVGRLAGSICDIVVLTNANWRQDFIQGVRSVSQKTQVVVWAVWKAKKELLPNLTAGDIVLCKGKESYKYFVELQK
jgi:UDP-N-acetylmuramoyl-tripeptide--D-alanyl-D-alanine ligase